MLDFQQGPKPRNYLSRREQWRLLVLVLMLGLVVIVALEARKPEHYQWLLGDVETQVGPSADGQRSAANRPVDTRVLADDQPPEIPGTFISPAPVKPEATATSRFFPGVQPELLSSIRDNRPLGPSEWDAWLHLFDVLDNNEEASLRSASTGRVSLVQLFEQSKEYRGELVTSSGILRRAHSAKTPRNDYGLTDYYQIWLWPDDHPNDPITVWCLDLPEGFPTGMEIAEEAEVTGFYFKLWAYKAADGKVLRAPMLLAKTIHWRNKVEAADSSSQGPLPLALIIAGAAVFAVLATMYVYYRSRGPEPSQAESLLRRGTLRDVKTSADVSASLQQLADSEDTPSKDTPSEDAPSTDRPSEDTPSKDTPGP